MCFFFFNHFTNKSTRRQTHLISSRGKITAPNKNCYLVFLGILLGIAIRTRKPIALNFCPMLWKLISNCSLTWKDLEDVDLHYARSLKALYSADSAGTKKVWSGEFCRIKVIDKDKFIGIIIPASLTVLLLKLSQAFAVNI